MNDYLKPCEMKTGVIGYSPVSGMGKNHLEQMSNAGMQPSCIVEMNPENRKLEGKELPSIKLYASIREMLNVSNKEG